MSYLDCAPRNADGSRRRIDIVDQTLRDGPQSWWGMRLRKDMGLPMAAELDRTGFHTIDLVGSSIFEVLVRHCKEDPWEQLISLSKAMPQTTVRAGTRSNGIVTFGLTADSVMDLWVQRLCAHGIGSFWIYDGLFNIDKIGRLVKTVQAEGAKLCRASSTQTARTTPTSTTRPAPANSPRSARTVLRSRTQPDCSPPNAPAR